MNIKQHSLLQRLAGWLTLMLLGLVLSACGGGGGSPGTTVGTPPPPVVVVPPAAQPTITLSLLDSSNAPMTTLLSGKSGSVKAKVADAAGAGVANVLVQFSPSTNGTLVLTPGSGAVLTDASGIATLAITPADGGSGALAIKADATVAGKQVTGTINLTVGAGADPKLTLTLTDSQGNTVNTLSGAQSGLVRATVIDGDNKPVAGAIVKYVASDTSLIEFSPASGSALTNVNGVAIVNIKPVSVNSAGAAAVTATSIVGTKSVSGTVTVAVGAAPLQVGTLSLNPAPTGKLPAFSAVTINIPITSGGQPATAVSGLSLSSLCSADNTATLVQGQLANGIVNATYTNNGCLRGTDVITVAIGNSIQTISIGVDPAGIGAISFVGSSTPTLSLVLKGSGGLGRYEAAQLTFRVVDQHNVGLNGVDVTFRATTNTGGLTVSPIKATTDADGNVKTTVSSGTIPTPVRIIAEATRAGVTISGLSDAMTISTGLPIQKNFSLSVSELNYEAWDYDNAKTSATVLMADQYGNPVSDGTVVNFITEGGAIGTSNLGACLTVNGECTVPLRSQNYRPPNGRVTILAYVQGLEDFIDMNGDGQYTCTNFKDADGKVPPVYRPLVDTCVSGGEPFTDMGDPFLDVGDNTVKMGVPPGSFNQTLDGKYDPALGDLPVPYNKAAFSATGDGKWGINYIRATTEVIFSGSWPTLVRQVCDSGGACRDWVASDGDPGVIHGAAGPACQPTMLHFRIFDLHNNPMPANTTLTAADNNKVAAQTVSPNLVGNSNAIGGTFHHVLIKPDEACGPGSFSIVAKTGKGNATSFTFTAPVN